MTLEMTADAFFAAGQCAPRGTYVCTATGMVHRLAKPAPLPGGGPFRMVAPAPMVAMDQSPSLVLRWPEEEGRPRDESVTEPHHLLSMAWVLRVGSGW